MEDQTKRRLENKNIEYKYPHDYKNNYVEQRYLPESVEEKFYNYQENVLEKELVDKYIKRRNQNEWITKKGGHNKRNKNPSN